MSKLWTAEDDRILRALYQATPTHELAAQLGRTQNALHRRAHNLGVRKTVFHVQSNRGCFPAGNKPWNAGLTGRNSGGRSAETRFKPGRAAHEYARYVPIGTLRIGADGRLIHIRASKVGENGIKPDVWYTLDAQGEFVESATKGVSE